MPGLSLGILLGALVIVASWLLTWVYVRWANAHYDPALRALRESAGDADRRPRIGQPNAIAMAFFFVVHRDHARHHLVGGAPHAARPSSSTPPGRTITAGQNGFALAGDYMSAASFLGIAGLVSTTGFDGLIYSTGWLVGWPVVLFLIAEPLRNLGTLHVRRRAWRCASGRRRCASPRRSARSRP